MKSDKSAGQFTFFCLLAAFICILDSMALAEFTTNSALEISAKPVQTAPVLSQEEQDSILGFAGDTSSNKVNDFSAVSPDSSASVAADTVAEPTKPVFISPVGTASLSEAEAIENSPIGLSKGKNSGRIISGSVGSNAPGTLDKSSADDSSESGTSSANKSSGLPSFWRAFFSLLAVIAVMIGLTFLARKLFPGQINLSMGNILQVIGRTPIDAKHNLSLVKFGNDLLLLGVSGENINLIDKVSDPDKVATLMGNIEAERVSSISKTFSSVFSKARDDYQLSNDLEDEEVVEDFPEDVSSASAANKELSGLLDKVKGLSRMKPKR